MSPSGSYFSRLCQRKIPQLLKLTFGSAAVAGLIFGLAACGLGDSGNRGAKGDPGPRGAEGPPGPPGPGGVRVVRNPCTTATCTSQCNDDEVLISAWCGAHRNAPLFPTERSASCHPMAANNFIVAVCAKAQQ